MVHVTQITPSGDRRALAVTERFAGGEGEVRGGRSDADTIFQWAQAAKDRGVVARATSHECRHDEGIMDCAALVTEA